MSADFFEIGWFQIENLMINQMTFVLFDLRKQPEVRNEPKAFWARAQNVAPHDVVTQAKSKLESPDQPLLLLCNDGQVSSRVAADLVKEGFHNLFVIEGGYQKLLSDWELTTNS